MVLYRKDTGLIEGWRKYATRVITITRIAEAKKRPPRQRQAGKETIEKNTQKKTKKTPKTRRMKAREMQ